jgi:hypothetical protein
MAHPEVAPHAIRQQPRRFSPPRDKKIDMEQLPAHGMEGLEIQGRDDQIRETSRAGAEQILPAFESVGQQADCLVECNLAQKEIEPSRKG